MHKAGRRENGVRDIVQFGSWWFVRSLMELISLLIANFMIKTRDLVLEMICEAFHESKNDYTFYQVYYFKSL